MAVPPRAGTAAGGRPTTTQAMTRPMTNNGKGIVHRNLRNERNNNIMGRMNKAAHRPKSAMNLANL